jgi:hypothetical protein
MCPFSMALSFLTLPIQVELDPTIEVGGAYSFGDS